MGVASGSAVEQMAEEKMRFFVELHGWPCGDCDGAGLALDENDEQTPLPCPTCGGRGRRRGMAEHMRVLAASIDGLAEETAAGADCGVCGFVQEDSDQPHPPECPTQVLARLRGEVSFTPIPDGT